MTDHGADDGADVPLSSPHSAVDVAEYILRMSGPMKTSKLQSLLYLAQGHHLAVTGQALFGDEIQARAEGPAVELIEVLLAGKDVVEPEFLRSKLEGAAETSHPSR